MDGNQYPNPELEKTLFREFTDILAKHNIEPRHASAFTTTFSSDWYDFNYQVLNPAKRELVKIPLKTFLENETAIRSIFLRATEELRLLLASAACESDPTKES